MSVFSAVPLALPVSVFQLTTEFHNDSRDEKVNLGISTFRTEEGKPFVLPVVKAIESVMATDTTLNHEYLPILGLPSFRDAAVKLCLGQNSPALIANRACGIQSVSGTGALRLVAEFLFNHLNKPTDSIPVLCSDPTWSNHYSIFRAAGFRNLSTYTYWNKKDRKFNVNGLLEDILAAEERSILILQSSCHNPTGSDPTNEEWKIIANAVLKKKHICIFDNAFQGLASGNPDEDAWAIRYFVSLDLELFVCQSFSKNFGLYNERAGNVIIVTKNPQILSNCKSQFELLIRQNYSNPPNHGARIVATALNNKSYYQEWLQNLSGMSQILLANRSELYEKLRLLGTPGSWVHLKTQLGFFSYTGLTDEQCTWLRQQKAIYLMKNGRVNISAINSSNVDYICKSIDEVVRILL